MVQEFPFIGVNIKEFNEARKKFDSCENKDLFFGIAYCKLFFYCCETPTDMLNHCGSCLVNKSGPSAHKIKVRGP